MFLILINIILKVLFICIPCILFINLGLSQLLQPSGQGFGGNDWQEHLAMEDSVAGDAMSGLSIPLVLSTTEDESSSAVYGSMQDGTGAMYGTRPDGTFYGSGQDGTGTVYGRGHQGPSPRKDESAVEMQRGSISFENDGAQIVYGEENSGDQYSYEEEDEVKDYGEDVYVETTDAYQTDEGHGKVVYFDVGKKQAEIDNIIIQDSDENENYHEQFEDIVKLDYANQEKSSKKNEYENTKSTDTSEESRFLTPIHFGSGELNTGQY